MKKIPLFFLQGYLFFVGPRLHLGNPFFHPHLTEKHLADTPLDQNNQDSTLFPLLLEILF